jgi:hypothetical protein
LLAALLLATPCACGDGDDDGGGGGLTGGRCLTDQQICQLQTGVTTTADARAALGSPQLTQSVGNGGAALQQWIYVCQQTADSVDAVQLAFDQNGVLFGVSVIRTGPNARPAPTCL